MNFLHVRIYPPTYKSILFRLDMIKQKCTHCEKEIEGYNEEQVKYLIAQHILAKHKDKIVWANFYTGKIVNLNKEDEGNG